ncbi:MAG: DeoR/GlpR family DNA-binding transcription regulator [Opitutaceae bacterium]|jgi:DeoR/GlpR family transcriptional regulator of sugar metabolism|nr:DeoR/GlpR family DNA-binding transcription regulator [Opitutaceae bacterium]
MKVARAIVDARRDRIAASLARRRYLGIAELCAQFGISGATARRDMNALEEAGRITRTRGGALGDYNSSFASFSERERRAHDAKLRVAELAVALLRPGAICYLDAGSTLLAVARRLAANPVENLTIVTNSLPAAGALGGAAGMRLYLLGGEVLDRQGALLGPKARAALRDWRFDTALLGAEGFDKTGVWNSHPDIVQFQRDILARARLARVCLDGGKLGHRTAHLLAAWRDAPGVITDLPRGKLPAFLPAGKFPPAPAS